MLLKCPKCRYSFEEQVSDRVSELSCVCPRCGTPFTFTRSIDPEVEQPQDSSEHTPTSSNENIGTPNVSESDKKNYTEQAVGNHSERSYQSDVQTTRHHHHHQQRRNDNYFYRLVATFICSLVVVVALCVFFLSKIISSKDPKPTIDETVSSTENIVDTTALNVENIDELTAEELPSWIVGQWKGKTRYFEIVLTIDEEGAIVETTDDRSARGHFIYNAHRLVCRFPENTTMVYNVNESDRTIDAGDGIMLKKAQ